MGYCGLVGWAIVLWLCGFFLCINPCVCKVFGPSFPHKLGQFFSTNSELLWKKWNTDENYYCVTVNIPTSKQRTSMNRLFTWCVHIDGVSSLMSLFKEGTVIQFSLKVTWIIYEMGSITSHKHSGLVPTREEITVSTGYYLLQILPALVPIWWKHRLNLFIQIKQPIY